MPDYRIFCLFARPYLRPGDLDFLAAYTSGEVAQAFIDAQDVDLQGCLGIAEVTLDRHPDPNDIWTLPT